MRSLSLLFPLNDLSAMFGKVGRLSILQVGLVRHWQWAISMWQSASSIGRFEFWDDHSRVEKECHGDNCQFPKSYKVVPILNDRTDWWIGSLWRGRERERVSFSWNLCERKRNPEAYLFGELLFDSVYNLLHKVNIWHWFGQRRAPLAVWLESKENNDHGPERWSRVLDIVVKSLLSSKIERERDKVRHSTWKGIAEEPYWEVKWRRAIE